MDIYESFFKLLKKLSDSFGVPGYEDDVRNIVVDEVRDSADEVYIDRFGNVIAVKKGSRRGIKIIWDAHMDEIGFFVKHIDDRGFIYLAPAGGWSERVLPGQRVKIRTSKGNFVVGVIGSKPPHLMKQEEKTQVIPIEKLFVDIGVSSRDEAEKIGVHVGSPVVIDRDTVRVAGYKATGKSFDDRVGVAVIIDAFKEVDPVDSSIYLVVATQEEVGLKGARVAAQQINPDAAFAVDVTTANDVPEAPRQDWVAEQGKGPVIKIVDGRNASGLIGSRKLIELLVETAKEEGIPFQLGILTGGTTDATAISLVGEGVPAAVIAVPTRYIHSPVEMLDLRDAVNASKLLRATTMRITKEWYSENLEKKKIK